MKAHVGVDADSGLVHSVVGTAANVSDVPHANALLHGHEEEAFGDAGYIGVDKRDEMKGQPVKWRVAAKRGKIKAMQEGPLKDLVVALERTKATDPRAGRASVSCREEPVSSSQGPLRDWPRTRRRCSACSRWRIW